MKTNVNYSSGWLALKGAALGLVLFGAAAAEAGQGPQPSICVRACWSARAPTCGISQMSTLNRAIIHHTAGPSDFSTDINTSKARIRAVQNLHIDDRGWCDIAYHFLVDAAGNVFEGRSGSMTSLPRGTHDGYNVNSFGFNVLGYYHPSYNHPFTTAARNSLEAVIAWRMPSAWSPYGSGTYNGNTVGTLDGHYKVKATACPGDGIIPHIPGIRDGVNNRKNGTPPPPPPATTLNGVVSYNQDGRMQLFIVGNTGRLYTSGQVANNQGVWSPWQDLGGNWPGRTPAVGRNLDGRMQVFLVGTDGSLYTSVQVAANQGVWTSWQSLGGNWVGKDAAVGYNADGRMQLFLIGTDYGASGFLWTKGQTANNQNTWGSWQSLGGNWPADRVPAVGRNLDGRIQVFLVGTDYGSTGFLWTSAQVAPNQGVWSSWQSMGGNWPGKKAAVGYNADGRMQVFMVGTDYGTAGFLYTSGQVSNNQNTWSSWQSLGGQWPFNRVPGVGRNLDGRIQLFMIGTDYGSTGFMWTRAQAAPNQGVWTSWQSMGGNWPVNPFVGKNADGRMQVFCIGTGHELDTSGQISNNQSSWSGWQNLGGSWPAF